MLKRFKKRKANSMSRSPKMARPEHPGHRGSLDATPRSIDVQMAHSMAQHHQTPLTPTYETAFTAHPESMAHGVPGAGAQPFGQYAQLDQIWRGFESATAEQLPVWLSDQSLGGQSFHQNGIDAFLLPPDYLPSGAQIW